MLQSQRTGARGATCQHCIRLGVQGQLGVGGQRTSRVILGLLWPHEAGDAAKDRGRSQRRGDEVSLAVHLHHEDANLEGAVDLAILHEVAPYDALVCGPRLRCIGRRGRRRANAHAATPLPARGRNIPRKGLALLHVLAQVQLDVAQCDLLRGAKFLHNLELKRTLGEIVALVNGYAHRRYNLAEIIVDPVVGNGAFGGAAAVLGVYGVGEVPFNEGVARDQRDVVEVVDLCGVRNRGGRDAVTRSRRARNTFKCSSNLGYAEQLSAA